ncbi:replication-relaxation family protein [Pseudonocardia nigra]|uniref:replication-relaxation family protein n=1 Tax=Pseudonocardia nigra TaxID=1921578 RepID=UPI001C5F06EC|nr:replication-relaxation family protein [Pseudonocardia nigra]
MITNPTRQRTLGGVLPSHPTARPGGRVRNSAEHQAALAWRLTPRDHWIVAMLAEHRVLTATQITDMAFPSFRSGRQRLRELHQWSVVDRFQPFATVGSAPMHYVLAPAGAAVLAATHGLEPRDLGYRHDRTLGIAHSLQLAHTVGVAEWFAALVAAARHGTATGTGTAAGPATLETWWSEIRCARLFGDLVRPDGYGRWTNRNRRVEFFLEFDLGTEALSRVAAKLAGYAALTAATGITTPLLVWLPTSRREAGARTALYRAWRDLARPGAVPVATAAAGLLDPRTPHPSPADPVWLPLHPVGTGRDGARLPLHRLTEAWPHLDHPGSAAPAEAGPSGTADSGTGPHRLPAPLPMPPAPSPRGRTTPAP